MNPYRTTTLLKLVDSIKSRPSFLRDRYFPLMGDRSYFKTESVLVEIKDGDRRLAPIVARGARDTIVGRPGERMTEYMPPRMAPARVLTVDDITKRGFGEALYSELSPEQRAARYAMEDMQDLDDMIIRREESMAAEVLLNNGCVLEGYADKTDTPVTDAIFFYDTSKTTANPARTAVESDWDDASADIIGDMEAMVTILSTKGLPASDFVCASDVAMAILNNEGVYKMLDNRRYNLGEVAPKLEADGASVVCVLNIMGRNINVISYFETYEDSDGNDVAYIPAGYGVMTAPGCGSRVYGAITQIEDDGNFHTYAKPRVPKVTVNKDDDVRKIRVASRALLMPNNVNPYVSCKVTGNGND